MANGQWEIGKILTIRHGPFPISHQAGFFQRPVNAWPPHRMLSRPPGISSGSESDHDKRRVFQPCAA
jgi:hypothetical protein